MAFEIKTVTTFTKADGSVAKPSVTETHANLSKADVLKMEGALLHALVKANSASREMLHGPKPGNTNPVTVRYRAEVLENGVVWTGITLDYPNLGDEAQAFLFGLFDGELAGSGRAKGHAK